MEIYSIRKRSKIINIGCIVLLGILLLLLAGSEHSTTSSCVICIILIFIAAFAKNNTVISADCVDNCISLFGLKLHGRWKWNKINYISIDFKRAAPNALVTVRKRKSRSARTAVFGAEYMQQLVDWAVAGNPDIRIDTSGPHNLKVKKQSAKPPAKAILRGKKLGRKVY